MKKNIKIFLLVVCLMLLCTGCQGDVTRALRHSGFSLSGKKIVCEDLFGKTPVANIRFLTDGHAITDTGEIYEMSPGVKYSNNMHCRKANTSIRVSAILNDTIALGTDGKMYSLVATDRGAAYSEIPVSDNNYEQYKLLFSTSARKIVSGESMFYGLSDDGNVYGYTLSQTDRNSPLAIVGIVIVYNKMDYGNIIDFGYAGNSMATYVKTGDRYYHLTVTNSKECSAYADVECSYIMAEDETLEKYDSYIAAYNGKSIYTTYNKYFTSGR